MKHWWPLITLASVLVAAMAALYIAGYRIGPSITLIKTRTLTVTGLSDGAAVFADYAPRGESKGNTLSIELVPGPHTILVTAQNYAAWTGLVTVPKGTDSSIAALLVPKAVSGTLLSGEAAHAARTLIDHATLPTEAQPLSMANGCALVFVSAENNTVVAAPTTTPACTPPSYLCASGTCEKTLIFTPPSRPSALFAYPGRQDALLVLIGQDLYALSLDPREPRTFTRVLHGIDPRAAVEPDGTIVVADQSSVYTLSL